MVGAKMWIAGSLPLLALASMGAIAADIKTQPPPVSLWSNDPFQYDSLYEMDDGVPNGIEVFSGKAAFFR
jgi:hypothetical protein